MNWNRARIKKIARWFILVKLIVLKLFIVQAQDGIYINEIQASNYSTLADNDFKSFSDWVELTNPNDFSLNIGGYYLTDDLQNPQKWQFPMSTAIPANGFLLVWCDDQDVVLANIHNNFKLNGSGEEIGIFDQNINLIDSVIFGEQLEDVSFGRKPDGDISWFYFADPTPNNPNLSDGFLTPEQPPNVDFSLESGFYNSSMNLILSCTGLNPEIRYTTDGSIPSQASLLFELPIPIDSTLVIRARTYIPGILPGEIISHTYLIMEETLLPTISMIINPDFLWDPDIGIYVDEDIEERTDWKRSCLLEYFNPEKNLDFTIDADIRLFGNTAFYYPQKTLSVFPETALEYKLFESEETDKFYSFLLRSSSDDWPYTMIRDALMQSIFMDQLKLDYQAYSPSVLFINGAYWGIHNIREKINERYLEAHHSIDPDNLDLVYMDMRDTTITSLAGDLDDMNEFLEFIQNNDLSTAENFEIVRNSIELDNYIDYLIAQIVYSNTSWHHNVKIWKSKDEGSKWQWLLYDLDRGMTPYYLHLNSVIQDIDTTDLFFSHFNQNNEFKGCFLSRFCGHLNSTFKSTRMIHFIDSLKTNIAEEIPEHSLRWKNECDPYGYCGIQSFEDWLEDINTLKDFSEDAPNMVTQYVMNFYGINEMAELSINITNAEKGKIYINGIEYKPGSGNWTYFKDIPLQIIAIPNTGQLFLEWTNVSYNDTLMLTLNGDSVLTARFGDYCILPAVIYEDMLLGENCDAYYMQGKFTIEPGANVTIKDGVHIIIVHPDSICVNGRLTINGTKENPVTIRPSSESSFWGCIKGSNAILNLTYANFVNCKSAIAMEGGELALDHSTVHYSPFFFSDIIAIHGAYTTISNSTLYGPDDAGKSDMIDCDEIPYGLLINNYINGTTDDGIDIGTGSVNVEITGNTILNCNSMGISVGETSQALIQRNVIVNCSSGIQVHSESTATIDHNTLYNNDVAIKCFHYQNEPLSGGHAIVTNSILSQSDSSVFQLFENSTISFSYSLSDTDTIPGLENINSSPQFINPDSYVFGLQESSPCINSGDPLYSLDPDGTRTDMGAICFGNNSNLQEQYSTKNIIIIIPNPSLGRFSIILNDSSQNISSVEIFDTGGNSVFKIDEVNNSIIHLDNGFGGQGIFFVSVITDKGIKYSGKALILSPKKNP